MSFIDSAPAGIEKSFDSESRPSTGNAQLEKDNVARAGNDTASEGISMKEFFKAVVSGDVNAVEFLRKIVEDFNKIYGSSAYSGKLTAIVSGSSVVFADKTTNKAVVATISQHRAVSSDNPTLESILGRNAYADKKALDNAESDKNNYNPNLSIVRVIALPNIGECPELEGKVSTQNVANIAVNILTSYDEFLVPNITNNSNISFRVALDDINFDRIIKRCAICPELLIESTHMKYVVYANANGSEQPIAAVPVRLVAEHSGACFNMNLPDHDAIASLQVIIDGVYTTQHNCLIPVIGIGSVTTDLGNQGIIRFISSKYKTEPALAFGGNVPWAVTDATTGNQTIEIRQCDKIEEIYSTLTAMLPGSNIVLNTSDLSDSSIAFNNFKKPEKLLELYNAFASFNCTPVTNFDTNIYSYAVDAVCTQQTGSSSDSSSSFDTIYNAMRLVNKDPSNHAVYSRLKYRYASPSDVLRAAASINLPYRISVIHTAELTVLSDELRRFMAEVAAKFYGIRSQNYVNNLPVIGPSNYLRQGNMGYPAMYPSFGGQMNQFGQMTQFGYPTNPYFQPQQPM